MPPDRPPRSIADRRIACLILIAAMVAACGTTPGFTILPGQLPSPAASASTAPAASPAASGGTSASPGGSAAPSASPGGSPGPSGSPAASGKSYTFVKKEACPESRFECITLAVPRDHTSAGGPTWDLTFGIQRASGTKLGTFVTVTGGPGYSGLASAESYTDAFDPTIPEHYDVVFFDQRGIGLSHPIQCPSATAVYYADTSDPAEPTEREAVATAARTYVDACMKESKADPADLPYYATTQATEDLEAFRDYLGADQLMLYGESYGTQFAQTYAAAHPERIKALLLDGPVDLVPDAIAYYTEGARAFDDVLHDTLQACRATAACRADIQGGDPLAAYDALATKLDAAPLSYRFPTAKGTFVERQLTLTDLQNLAYAYTYGPDDRSQFLRDLAAATHGDYVPMARAAYDSIVVDPETLEAIPDPTYSDAMYYATECQDYAFYLGAGSPEARLNAWLDAGEKLGINKLRLGATFYGDIPCVFWPAQPKADARPKP
ncbi:MAG: alpha/beta hydrolase, partial [Chloroflexota bacterium]|nr:alpha/beta hydrolase [Chloroflexota bacterium]